MPGIALPCHVDVALRTLPAAAITSWVSAKHLTLVRIGGAARMPSKQSECCHVLIDRGRSTAPAPGILLRREVGQDLQPIGAVAFATPAGRSQPWSMITTWLPWRSLQLVTRELRNR